MNLIQVPLPRVLIMLTDKASREQVAGILNRYGYSIVGPFAKWSEASSSIRSDAIEAAVLHLPALAKTLRSAVPWRSADEVGIAFV